MSKVIDFPFQTNDSVDTEEREQIIQAALENAPSGMSDFQIERFLIGAEPPIGRYFQACLEIKTRYGILGNLHQKKLADFANSSQYDDQIRAVERELNSFVRQAKKWKEIVGDKTFEDIQFEYWDQRLAYQLLLRILSGRGFDDLVQPIFSLPDESTARRFLEKIVSDKFEKEEAEEFLLSYESGDITRPRLPDR